MGSEQKYYHLPADAESFAECLAAELNPEWNIHLSSIEPGLVRTGIIERRKKIEVPPAYNFEGTFQNLVKYLNDPKSPEEWTTPEGTAEGIYVTVSSDGEIPRRVPLGRDAWAMFMTDHERTGKELAAAKELAMKVGKATED